jgi:hypothetical protein
MAAEVSTFRLYLLRTFYLLNFVGLTFMTWPSLLRHQGPWDPLHGVAFSFWAALGLLMGVGMREPLKMLPVIFIQLVYKSIWIATVMLPSWAAGRSVAFTNVMIVAAIFDLIVIPWPYVLSHYVRRRDRAFSDAQPAAVRP